MDENITGMDESKATKGFVHAVYEESPYGILVFNSQQVVVDWNPAVEKLIGLNKDACMGKPLQDVFASAEKVRADAAFATQIKATLVVSEHLASYFIGSVLNGMKVSIIVDKSGAVNGGTLILTAVVAD